MTNEQRKLQEEITSLVSLRHAYEQDVGLAAAIQRKIDKFQKKFLSLMS